MNSGTWDTFSPQRGHECAADADGVVAAMPGETWNFTAWHCDANPSLTSTFTDAVSATFQ
jgi:hypothetical protein